MMTRKNAVLSIVLVLFASMAASAVAEPNVILMISDGIGFNGWEAARFYQGSLPYDNQGFEFYGCTTYADGGSYNSSYVWDQFQNHMNGATDSAAAATALYTGQKTYSGAIGMDVSGQPIPTIAEIAAGRGMATGAVTSVEYSHATPGAVDAHNVSRNNYGQIAMDMVTSDLDVIMGGDNRAPGTGIYAEAAANGFDVVNDSNMARWDEMANGVNLPSKVFGGFSGSTLNGRAVPTLETMTKAALNVLGQDEDGFFLMVEGGAVDWNNHANAIDLMMREQVDFDNSVAATMAWIEANGGWANNLLIITSDHECGSIWGEGSGGDTFTHVVDNGVGVMPTVDYYSGGHTNHLVPLWAKGVGADGFAGRVDSNDALSDAFWTEATGWNWNGDLVDNTDVFAVMNSVVPEPATMSLLALGAAAAIRRRRR